MAVIAKNCPMVTVTVVDISKPVSGIPRFGL